MRRDQVEKKMQKRGLAPLSPIRRNMISVVYKRLKCHVLHKEKFIF